MNPLMLLGLVKRFWFTIPIALLFVALVITRSSNAHHREQLATCNAKQAMNLATIDGLLGTLADQNARVEQLAAAGNAKQKAAQEALRAAQEREKAGQATVDALRRSAGLKRADSAPCVVSDSLASARGL